MKLGVASGYFRNSSVVGDDFFRRVRRTDGNLLVVLIVDLMVLSSRYPAKKYTSNQSKYKFDGMGPSPVRHKDWHKKMGGDSKNEALPFWVV